jgi:hypothetical protein
LTPYVHITGKILTENINICSDILTIIFTNSIQSGKVPSDWNHANVTPVFKKGTNTALEIVYISHKLVSHANYLKTFSQAIDEIS